MSHSDTIYLSNIKLADDRKEASGLFHEALLMCLSDL